ncbi:uncharacterized protein C8Q71DRAFT_706310 [Rhodofomes roseus]|uniref:Reverse transcriptase zinc-binding domain-containing protein n=1 Tax=Rhodofomes roseus TaxID=34475 RepID=A0ABQ8KI78_9APHY|nr:uncharacterized protein C8Q71DRAFT_706310 [Rhodofomes roseus]KAH9837663.1 hypothetical protein C8Q71DRAFT_706310 [Rhodofomes roseus]
MYEDRETESIWVTTPEDLPTSTNTRGEALAALKVVQDAPKDAPLRIICSSRRLITDLTVRLSRWEDKGWIGIADAQLLRTLVNHLRQRCAPTILSTPESPQEQQRAQRATDLAAEQLRTGHPNQVPMATNPSFNLSGAKMSSLTQSTAYRGIRLAKRPQNRRGTERRIKDVLKHLVDAGTPNTSEAAIWRSLRNKDLHKKTTDFLWKSLHGTHRIGDFWDNIPGYEDRGRCAICNVLETMEHILVNCKAKGRAEVWTLTKALWKRKKQPWKQPKMEDILASGMGLYPTRGGSKRREHLSRLWRIIIPEVAYLIWKLRCERVIAHAEDDDWQHASRAIT